MSFRIIYHNEKIFFYNDYNNFQQAITQYELIENNNKILLTLPNNDILKKEGNAEIINKLIIYNKNNIYHEKNEKKYHVALYFLGHILPNCEKTIELQMNNYINCTYDIYVVTEKKRVYGRFRKKQKVQNLLNYEDFDSIENLTDEQIKKMFGKYSKYIRAISYIDNHQNECNKILEDNKKYYEENIKEPPLRKSIEIEYFKLYKAHQLKEEYKNENNVSYDFIVRTRPDLILKNQLKFCEYYVNHSDKYVFGRNNLFIFSNEKNMKWVSQLITNYYRCRGKYGCERQMVLHIESKGLKYFHKIDRETMKPIKMFRYWLLNSGYFIEHTKRIPKEEDKKFWQILNY